MEGGSCSFCCSVAPNFAPLSVTSLGVLFLHPCCRLLQICPGAPTLSAVGLEVTPPSALWWLLCHFFPSVELGEYVCLAFCLVPRSCGNGCLLACCLENIRISETVNCGVFLMLAVSLNSLGCYFSYKQEIFLICLCAFRQGLLNSVITRMVVHVTNTQWMEEP